jgi:hypothetical protein
MVFGMWKGAHPVRRHVDEVAAALARRFASAEMLAARLEITRLDSTPSGCNIVSIAPPQR